MCLPFQLSSTGIWKSLKITSRKSHYTTGAFRTQAGKTQGYNRRDGTRRHYKEEQAPRMWVCTTSTQQGDLKANA